jgi:hypothetical protein
MRHGHREALSGFLAEVGLEPGCLFVRGCQDDDLVGREPAQCVFDCLQRIDVTAVSLDLLARQLLRGNPGPIGRVGARVILGVGQPIEPRDL